jgi:hypothetical protein
VKTASSRAGQAAGARVSPKEEDSNEQRAVSPEEERQQRRIDGNSRDTIVPFSTVMWPHYFILF